MKFYTLQLFQRAPAAPARGEWSPALNMQFCPHCQTLNDKSGTTCTRCSQPLVAFGRGPAPPATGGFEFARRMTHVDDVVPSRMHPQDVSPAPGEVSRPPLFSSKLALVLGAAALGVAMYSIVGSDRLHASLAKLTERLASVREPQVQGGANAPGKDAPSRDMQLPAPLPGAVAGNAPAIPSTAAVSGSADSTRDGGPAVPPSAASGSQQATVLPAAAPKPAAIPPEPTRLDSVSPNGRPSALEDTVSRSAGVGAPSPAPVDLARADEPAQTRARSAKQTAAPAAGQCSDAVKTLGLCDPPKKN